MTVPISAAAGHARSSHTAPAILPYKLAEWFPGFQYGAVAIMAALRRISCLIGVGVLTDASAMSLPHANTPGPQSASRAVAIMDPQIMSFARSLAVSTSQVDAVTKVLSDDFNVAAFLQGKSWDAKILTSTACTVLKLVLEEVKVDTKPVDSAPINDNWFVPILLEPFL
jgi:hypothetical protein